MTHLRFIGRALRCVILTLLPTLSATAQNFDYGQAEALFGEPVTTSATGTPQRASDVAANMTILTAEDIRRSGARNIPDALKMVPGLDVLQEGYNVYDIGIRGYQQPFQPRLLVLVDGRQVFLDDYSRTLWDNVPVNIADIRQIEIVKGASSALFGSNAAGGVINIVTYSPIYDDDNSVRASAGTQQGINGDLTTTDKGDWGGTKFTIGGLRASEFDTWRYPLDSNPPYDPRHLYATNSSAFKLAPNLILNEELTAAYSVGTTGDPTDFGITGSQVTHTSSARIGADWAGPLGAVLFNAYYNHSFADLNEATDGGQPYGLLTNMAVFQLGDSFKVGSSNTLRFGVEYRDKAFQNFGVQAIPQVSKMAEKNYAANGMWLWQTTERLSTTVALRADQQAMRETGTLLPNAYDTLSDFDHTNRAWSGNLTVLYKLTSADSLRFGLGRGIQLPSIMNNGWNIILDYAGTPSDFEGNPLLKPTVVNDANIDWEHQLPSLGAVARVSVYHETNTNIMAPFALNPGYRMIDGYNWPVFIAGNVGSSSGSGGELQLSGRTAAGLRWDVSYSLAEVHDSAGTLALVNYQGSTPKSEGRVSLGKSIGRWDLDLRVFAVGARTMLRSPDGGAIEGPQTTPGYTSVNGQILYHCTSKVSVALAGSNLTDPEQRVSPYPALQRQVYLTLNAGF
jgi:iron complex outermembrane receptor protein